jgi:hypothetical protein
MDNGLGGQAASGAVFETDGGHGHYIVISVRSVRSHFCTGVSGWLTEVRISQDWVRERQEVERRSHTDRGQKEIGNKAKKETTDEKLKPIQKI